MNKRPKYIAKISHFIYDFYLRNKKKKKERLVKDSLILHCWVGSKCSKYLVSFDEGKVKDGRVVGMDARDGLKQAKILERISDGERSERVVGEQEEWPSEPDTVEPHGFDSLGDHTHGLLV